MGGREWCWVVGERKLAGDGMWGWGGMWGVGCGLWGVECGAVEYGVVGDGKGWGVGEGGEEAGYEMEDGWVVLFMGVMALVGVEIGGEEVAGMWGGISRYQPVFQEESPSGAASTAPSSSSDYPTISYRPSFAKVPTSRNYNFKHFKSTTISLFRLFRCI